MSFLDNLENTLKIAEGREERESSERQGRRETERAHALASAGFADQLRQGRFTAELLKQVTRLGHAHRIKVRLAWLGTTLRLEARGCKLELRPTPDGVVATSTQDGREIRTEPVDLSGNPETLAEAWLASLPPLPEMLPEPE
jgi:hypothetical protein